MPHDGGGVIHTARAAGTADGPGVGVSGAPGRGGWSGGDTASHSAGSIAARGGVSLWRRGCCILPALCDARAGVSLRRGRSFGAGLSVGAVGAGWARGWMDERGGVGRRLRGGRGFAGASFRASRHDVGGMGREWSRAGARDARRSPGGGMAASVRGTRDSPRRLAAAGWFYTRELRHGARKRGTNAIPNSSRIAPHVRAGCAERRLVAHAARWDSRNTRRDARTLHGAGGGVRRVVSEQAA